MENQNCWCFLLGMGQGSQHISIVLNEGKRQGMEMKKRIQIEEGWHKGGYQQPLPLNLKTSQAILAEGHLSLPEVSAWAEPAVFGVGTSTAIEYWLFLQVALLT